MNATTKSLIFAAFALSATAQAADQRWAVEGAYPAFPGTPDSGIASLNAPAPAAVAAAPTAEKTSAKAPSTGCSLKVQLTSLHAVGEPCLTTTDVMNQLGLSAKAQARVEHLASASKGSKAAKGQKTAH